jgi:hypothetical protein
MCFAVRIMRHRARAHWLSKKDNFGLRRISKELDRAVFQSRVDAYCAIMELPPELAKRTEFEVLALDILQRKNLFEIA